MDTERIEHIHIDKQSPTAYKALVGVANTVSTVAKEAGLPRSLVELVNIRVSQLNGCASCLEIHHRRASAAGVSDKQLATVSVWRDTELFDEREQAALRLAEVTTTLPDRDTLDREYARAAMALTPDELSAVVWVATAINAFNRVSVMSGHVVRPEE
ncbi:carboxymuconolactone decarboxylase family protein [Mycolicibacterium confluentis]|uniref:Alkyl hydroperoxide reductase AhpD n=1 Tax=Mycolicibacterium confluentis TaxID=28047 RepID=A0A7I7Y0U3_9MYCO|nr:carboxymuconolactone decarboxylase family protein [Mycolicibacterium confluentis]MCV7320244.1 carboxymuconolactone decarboxylase family protein [Mycolicibacterium confluentis]ORV34763.1 carboxymuconolactone decarboxylase [Mycolicibacterium confluentis]BBZ35280.1 alkyl hydroperoxide reductase AhpD [Mycolicibacterium confluentis]